MNPRQEALRNFLLGGVLPIAAFAIVEQFYGTTGGIIAGLAFGGAEVAWELWKHGKVHGITLLSNGLVLGLGLLSLWEKDGTFFKMQPAIFMLVMAGVFLISSLLGKPFLVEAAKKQNPHLPPFVLERFRGVNVRVGFFFIALAGLSVWSALYWSTAAWATLKGVGLPVLLGAYLLVEVVLIRVSGPPRA